MMLRKVKIERMRELADLVERVPAKDFTLTSWFLPPRPAFKCLDVTLRPERDFVGCAMGWAAHTKIFPGLTLDRDRLTLLYGRSAGFEAASLALGITLRTAWFLLGPKYYKRTHYGFSSIGAWSPNDVAARLRRFADIVQRRLVRQARIKAIADVIGGYAIETVAA
jgi:hypothetical protein